MEQIFIKLVNMSLLSTYVIVVVLIARLLLKKAPKIYSYLLWAVVFARLICPFSPESAFSLIPAQTQQLTVQGEHGSGQPSAYPAQMTVVGDAGPVLEEAQNPPADARTAMPDLLIIAGFVWAAGVIALVSYLAYTSLRWQKELRGARHEENNIYTLKDGRTPFVFGFFKPRIYLPDNLKEKEKAYILLHEQVHVRRRDYWTKPLAFLIACLHWFNPFVWAAYYYMCADMEESCDESVLRSLGSGIKQEYSLSLLCISTGRRFEGSPVSFSESSTKGRILHVLTYKKPAFWVAGISLLLVLLLSIGLFLNPGAKEGKGTTAAAQDTGAVDKAEAEALAAEWAAAFQGGDSKALEAMYAGRELNYEKMSSPWPWQDNYRILVEGDKAVIYYYAQTSLPEVTVWIETLTLGYRDRGAEKELCVQEESVEYMYAVDTYDKFMRAYYIDGAYAFPDFGSTGYGYAEVIAQKLEETGEDGAGLMKEYNLFRGAEGAAVMTLHLLGGTSEKTVLQDEDGQTYNAVIYTFQDGQQVTIPVYVAAKSGSGELVWSVGYALPVNRSGK